jgi:Transposase DDE domain
LKWPSRWIKKRERLTSTNFHLHPSLSELFMGHGGTASKSSMRIQLVLDYPTGRIHVKIGDVNLGDALTLQNFVENNDLNLSGTCLFISDLGYFKLATFEAIQKRRQFFLFKLMYGVKIMDANGNPVNLKALLKKKPGAFRMAVTINGHAYRLTGQRLSDPTINERIRKANQAALGKKKRHITDDYRLFLHYALFLTNLPMVYSTKALYTIYRVRWQIELVFKTWKSILGIHKIRSAKYHRVMCEIYGKLILAVLCFRLTAHAEFASKAAISPHRAMQLLRSVATAWAMAIVQGPRTMAVFTEKHIQRIQRLCKKHRQKTKPTIEFRLQQFGPRRKQRTMVLVPKEA